MIEYAKSCSWRAGPNLAKQMQEKKFSDWERVFVAIEEKNIAGFCTILKTQDVPNSSYTLFIGYVFVGEDYRGNRLSEKLIINTLAYAKDIGFTEVFLVSGEKGLYEKYGFKILGDEKNLWGNSEQIFRIEL